MDLKRNYTKHLKLSPDTNFAIGGKDENLIGKLQGQLLIDNGLQKDSFLLDLGCGTGRLLLGVADYLKEGGSYLGIDLVDKLIKVTEQRIQNLGLNSLHFRTQFMKNELDYPSNLQVDYICAFSVYTHMEAEDIFNSLNILRNISHKDTTAFVTFLPLEFEFGKALFAQEARIRLNERYDRVRNYSLTESMAKQISSLAGWDCISSNWFELDEPYDGVNVKTNQTYLVLKPKLT